MGGPEDLETAFVAVVEAERPKLRTYIAAIVGRGDADEVTQDAFLRAYRALPGFRGDGPLEAWLLRIARSAAIDHVRRSRRRPPTVGIDTLGDGPRGRGGDVGPVVAGGEIGVELDMLIANLSADVREAFVLTQVMGCSYEEAARVAEVPTGTIRSRVFRARRDLVGQLTTGSAGDLRSA